MKPFSLPRAPLALLIVLLLPSAYPQPSPPFPPRPLPPGRLRPNLPPHLLPPSLLPPQVEPPPWNPGDLTVYPWSDTNGLVRVPKELLQHLEFPALDYPVHGLPSRATVSPLFIGIFSLTPAQADALILLTQEARNALRRAVQDHLTPVEDPPTSPLHRDRPGLTVLDQRAYHLQPYQDALDLLESDFQERVSALLGEVRGHEFWNRSGFDQAFHPRTSGSEHFVYRLIQIAETNRTIDLVRFSPGGSMGLQLSEEDDRHAPESLQPVLARWRARLRGDPALRPDSAGESVASAPAPVIHAAPSSAVPASSDQVAPKARAEGGSTDTPILRGPWDDTAPFFEFAKTWIPDLGLTLIRNDAFTPEAAVVLGLTSEELHTASSLFVEYRTLFDRLEAEHLFPQNLAAGRYRLRSFPEPARALREAWKDRLSQVLGQQRAELVDRCLATPETRLRQRWISGRRGPFRMPSWPIWLLRGQQAHDIQATFEGGPDGGSFNLEVKDADQPNGRRWSRGGSLRAFPQELRHLFPQVPMETPLDPKAAPF